MLVAEFKGRDPFYFINKAKLVFAGNNMPSLSKLDGTSAFTDRIVFLLFNYTVPEEQRDFGLVDEILNERNNIVRWAVEGLRRLQRNGFIFTEPEDSRAFKRQYMDSLNNVEDFVKERCEISPDYKRFRVLRRDLYNEYMNYCQQNCMKLLTKEEFFTEVLKLPVESHKFRYRGSSPLWGFYGIALKHQIEKSE